MENEKDEKRGTVPAELMDKVTPMMQQYLRIKQQDPDPVLFSVWAIFTRCSSTMPSSPRASWS